MQSKERRKERRKKRRKEKNDKSTEYFNKIFIKPVLSVLVKNDVDTNWRGNSRFK